MVANIIRTEWGVGKRPAFRKRKEKKEKVSTTKSKKQQQRRGRKGGRLSP